MTLYNGLIGLFWIIFIVYWLIAAASAKKNVGGEGFGTWLWMRVLVVVVAIFLFRSGLFNWIAFYDVAVAGNPIIHLVGVILCGVGIAFAIWARVYLGKNWGRPMSVKKDPELVTSGPYAYVRHPIYSGILLAILGSVLASTLAWLFVLACAGAYFIYSATKEEALMAKQFPNTYPAYKKHTKMLLPFIL